MNLVYKAKTAKSLEEMSSAKGIPTALQDLWDKLCEKVEADPQYKRLLMSSLRDPRMGGLRQHLNCDWRSF